MAKTKGKKTGVPGQEVAGGENIVVAKAKEFVEFFEESKVEIKKVVWPTRKEVIATCGAVIVFTVIVSIYLGLVDWGLSAIVRAILS